LQWIWMNILWREFIHPKMLFNEALAPSEHENNSVSLRVHYCH
jgi:hypothetical protein